MYARFRINITYIRRQTILKSENHSKSNIPSLALLTFSVLSISDGLTTMIGLSRGFRESEALAGFLLNTFGIQGFLAFKIAIAIVVATVALLYGEKLHKGSEFTSLLFLTISVSLVLIAAVPVVNNVTLLGWA